MASSIHANLDEVQKYPEYAENVDRLTIELHGCTYNIHAGFLYEYEGEDILREICLLVSEAPVEDYDSHWTVFASILGVTREQQRNIENDFKGKQSPVWWVLLAYIQFDDATLNKVILALDKIKRDDIIRIINYDVRQLVDYVTNHADLRDEESKIIRPPTIEWAPLVLRPSHSTVKKVHKYVNITIIENPNVQDDKGIINTKENNASFAMRVMLTFADDGIEAAERIAKKFRLHRPRIGVLILREQLDHVFVKATEFISDCFQQVDVIVPILTNGYMHAINNCCTSNEPISPLQADQKYVKFIYESLVHEFENDACKTRRVRPIIPDDEARVFPKNKIVLRAWSREGDMETLIDLLLDEISEKR